MDSRWGKQRDFGRLFLDLFQQQRYLINGVDVRLKLVRSKNELTLFHTGSEKPKIVIEKAILYVRKYNINPDIENEHAFGLSKQLNAIYPINHTEVSCMTIAQGSQNHMKYNLFFMVRYQRRLLWEWYLMKHIMALMLKILSIFNIST